MIGLKRITPWQAFIKRVFPARRRKCEAGLREAMRWLMEHPEAPCAIDGVVIPNGYGSRGDAGLWESLIGKAEG